MRNCDIFARYGGEEFVLAMPDTGLREAMFVAERLRHAIEMLADESERLAVTASIGVAEAQGMGETTFEGLLSRADESMYRSKHLGRNRVTQWENEPAQPEMG